MIALILISWFIFGYVIALYSFAKISDRLVVDDLIIALVGGLAGPTTLLIALPYLINMKGDTVIWQRKKKDEIGN